MAYGVVSSMNLCYATTRLRDVVPPTQIHQPTTYIKDVVNSFTPPAAMPSHGTMGVRRAQLPPNDRTAAPGVRVKHTHPMKTACEGNTSCNYNHAHQCPQQMALANTYHDQNASSSSDIMEASSATSRASSLRSKYGTTDLPCHSPAARMTASGAPLSCRSYINRSDPG